MPASRKVSWRCQSLGCIHVNCPGGGISCGTDAGASNGAVGGARFGAGKGAAASAGGMVRAPSYLSAVSAAGPRGHLVRLAPSLIGSIGQPPMTGSSAPLPHECIELQLSVRGCLLQLAEELGLTG